MVREGRESPSESNFFHFPALFGKKCAKYSIGSSGWVGGGAKKHEIYVAAIGGHLFYDLFLQGLGGPWPPRHPPGSATEIIGYCPAIRLPLPAPPPPPAETMNPQKKIARCCHL